MRCLLALASLVLASTAYAAPCNYGVGYSSQGITNACFFDATPAGCPVHALVPRPTEVSVTLYRGDAIIPNTATVTNAGLLMQTYQSFDYFSCDCTRTFGSVQFDEIEIAIPEAREGDNVFVAGAMTEIGPAAPCSPAMWPTQVDIATGGCDPCTNPHPGDDTGCSAGGPVGFGSVLAFLALFTHRRRTRMTSL